MTDGKVLSGRAPGLARWIWLAVVAVYLVMFVLGLPLLLEQYRSLTGGALVMGFQRWTTVELRAALAGAGLGVDTWAAVRLLVDAVNVAGWVAMGLVIFFRGARDWFGLFVSFFLVSFGLTGGPAYEVLATARPALEPWLTLWASLPWLAFYLFFYTFPSGTFVPRWTATWSLVFLPLMLLGFLFFPGLADVIGWPLIAAAFGSALFAQVYRFLRVSEPVQRAQTKWVTFAIVVIGLGEIIGQGLLPVLFPALVADPLLRLRYSMILVLGVPLFLLVPLAIGIAVLRYRLWDIDLIIRRTLIYSVLSALLAMAYLGSVLLLQSVFGGLTGNAQSPLVTVLSTLAIAALFFPLRARVQGFIDRRFYRRTYDAARTLAAFAATARDETDLERLGAQLATVVGQTLEPEHTFLWLRDSKREWGRE